MRGFGLLALAKTAKKKTAFTHSDKGG